MNIKDLEEYRWLKKEVIQLNESLERLLNNKNALVFDTVKASSHQLPYQERIIPIQGLSHKYIATYEKRKQGLEERLNHCLDKIAEIEDFIRTVRRSDIRQIIEYRYIRNLEWVTVSRRVYGEPSEDRARKAVTRFFAEI